MMEWIWIGASAVASVGAGLLWRRAAYWRAWHQVVGPWGNYRGPFGFVPRQRRAEYARMLLAGIQPANEPGGYATRDQLGPYEQPSVTISEEALQRLRRLQQGRPHRGRP